MHARRRIFGSAGVRRNPKHGERPTEEISQRLLTSSPTEKENTFTNADVYAHERELAQLHPDNRHIKDKIRQQLQVLRDLGILSQPGRGEWALKMD